MPQGGGMTAQPLYDLLLVLSWTNAKLDLNVKNCELILLLTILNIRNHEYGLQAYLNNLTFTIPSDPEKSR